MHVFGLGKLQTFLHDVHCAVYFDKKNIYIFETEKKGTASRLFFWQKICLCNVECLRSFLKSFSLTTKLARHYLQVLFKF